MRPDPSPRLRRRAPWWLAAGAAVLLATVWGAVNPTDSLVVHDLLDHPVVHGLAGYLLLAWGARSLVRDPQRRLVVTILLAALGATAIGLIGMVLSVGVLPGRDEQLVAAPIQPGVAPYEADVVSDGDEISPLVTVVVRHHDWSPGARWARVACLNVEGRGGLLESARWEGPERLVVRLGSGREVPLLVDPETARVREPVTLGRRCGASPTH